MAAKQQGMIEHGRSRRAAPAAQQLPVRHAPNRHGQMSGAYQPATTFDEEMPVRCLGALVAELKACILERLEPGQDWAGFAVHLTARGRWCFVFDGTVRREWYGRTFSEALDKLTAWLELDEAQAMNLTLGLAEDGRFRGAEGA
jgi:hypothetical protein